MAKSFLPIPPSTTPDETVCLTLQVPNSPEWISAVWWILDQYNYWYNWQRTDDKRGVLIAQRWRQMFWQAIADNEGQFSCPADILNQIGIHLDEDISMNIRISPDDSCIIQMWCIDHWEDWYDPRSCVAGTIEQPTNGDGIAAGECREWDVSLRGNEKWLLPAVVSEGDTIEITNVSGAWNDGGIGWNCPNGFTYALGACVSAEPADGGDPLQTSNHMRLIANIDGDWFDAYAQIIAIGTGVSDGQVYFQANDDPLEGNSGAIAFHVKLCRFEPAPSIISITYAFGTGVTTLTPVANDEWIINVNSEPDPYGEAVRMSFSEPVKLTVLQTPNFAFPALPAGLFAFQKLGGSTVEDLNNPPDDYPTDFTPGNTCDDIEIDTGGGGSAVAWTLQLKIERV